MFFIEEKAFLYLENVTLHGKTVSQWRKCFLTRGKYFRRGENVFISRRKLFTWRNVFLHVENLLYMEKTF